jgi:hypothetical protein
MAIALNGINGPFVGKVGAVVGYVSNGRTIMRGLPTGRTRKPSIPQRQQHMKFSLMNRFLKSLIPFLNETNKSAVAYVTGYNKAFSYNVKNAIRGTYPDLAIDYSMALLSRGDLPNVKSPAVEVLSEGRLHFGWTDNTGTGLTRKDDKAFVAIYCEKLNDWEYGMQLGDRSSGTCLFNASRFNGHLVQAWLGFLSAGGTDVSDSLYIGEVQVQA